MSRWNLDKNGVTPSIPLTHSEQDHLNTFMNQIRLAGVSPKEAAVGWDSNYKKLRGTRDQYEIRLSQGNRATFLVDDERKIVTMEAVGGHT